MITGKFIQFDYIFDSFLDMKQRDEKFRYKVQEYKAILKNFNDELIIYNHDQIQNPIIYNFILYNRRRVNELLTIQKCEERLLNLQELDKTLHTYVEQKPGLANIVHTLVDIFKKINFLYQNLDLSKFEHYKEYVNKKYEMYIKQISQSEKLAFEIVDSKLAEYEKRNINLFNSNDLILCVSKIKISREMDIKNQSYLTSIIRNLNKQFHGWKYKAYLKQQENGKKFINLKDFFLYFKQLDKDAKSFLYLEDIEYPLFVHNCQKLLADFSRLESYLEKDYMNEFLNNSDNGSISIQLIEWNSIKEAHKKALFKFIQKVIRGQERDIKKFYQNFSIATTTKEFNSFLLNENQQLSQYNQMKTFSHIFNKETEELFQQKIHRISFIMMQIIDITKWIFNHFQADIMIHIKKLTREYKNDFYLSDKNYLTFLENFLKGITRFMRQLQEKVKQHNTEITNHHQDSPDDDHSDDDDDDKKCPEVKFKDYFCYDKIENNYQSLKTLYLCSKPLFFINILKDLEFIKDNKLLTQIEHFELIDEHSYDMDNFKKVLQTTDKDLRNFMENFLNLNTNYQACFEDFQIIKIDQFEKDLEYLTQMIEEKELQDFEKFIQILKDIMDQVNHSDNSYFERIIEKLINAKKTCNKLELLENFHGNLVVHSLQRRTDFKALDAIQDECEVFFDKFKREKLVTKQMRDLLTETIEMLQIEFKYHHMGNTKNPCVKIISKQIKQLLSEFNNDRTTLKLLNEIFEKKEQHLLIFRTFKSLSSLLWQNESLTTLQNHHYFKQFLNQLETFYTLIQKRQTKQIKQTILPYIDNIAKSLADMIRIVKQIDNFNYEIEGRHDIDQERLYMVLFHKKFKQYLINMRDNVVFIYPKTCLVGNFPCFIMKYKYRQQDTLETIYDAFKKAFPNLNKQYRTRTYKDIFTKASIQELISQKKRSWDGFFFENRGPIDLIINLDKKIVTYTGKVRKPFPISHLSSKIQIFVKQDSVMIVDSINEPLEKFTVKNEQILYPFGLFLKVQVEGCKDIIRRLETTDLYISIPKTIQIQPILKKNELVKIYIEWLHNDIEKQNSFVDMNAHVDVHEIGKEVLSLFEYNIEEHEDRCIKIIDHFQCQNNHQMSEITFYEGINSYKTDYYIYLYAFCNTFKEIQAQCQVYQKGEEDVQFLLSDKDIIGQKIWGICKMSGLSQSKKDASNFKVNIGKQRMLKQKASKKIAGLNKFI